MHGHFFEIRAVGITFTERTQSHETAFEKSGNVSRRGENSGLRKTSRCLPNSVNDNVSHTGGGTGAEG